MPRERGDESESAAAVAVDTSEFNIYTAARIQKLSGFPVSFINEGDDVSPDLRVDDLAYVECKDLHPASRAGLANSLQDNVDKAIKQLQTAQATDPLRGTGICVDVPWGMLPLVQGEWQVITDALLRTSGPSFVLVSCSGVSITNGEIGFPVAGLSSVDPCRRGASASSKAHQGVLPRVGRGRWLRSGSTLTPSATPRTSRRRATGALHRAESSGSSSRMADLSVACEEKPRSPAGPNRLESRVASVTRPL